MGLGMAKGHKYMRGSHLAWFPTAACASAHLRPIGKGALGLVHKG